MARHYADHWIWTEPERRILLSRKDEKWMTKALNVYVILNVNSSDAIEIKTNDITVPDIQLKKNERKRQMKRNWKSKKRRSESQKEKNNLK